MPNTNEKPNIFSKRSKNARTAGRSGVFFEKGGGFLSDVFRRQAIAAEPIAVLDLSRSWSRKRKPCAGRLKQASKPLEEHRIVA
jgi:hypothetical protein